MTTQMRSHVICSPDAPADFRLIRCARPSLSRWAARRVLSPGHWICAGLLGSVLACPACAQEAWNPFSRAPRDPIEQGRIDSANDPAEAINRNIFKANKLFDDIILKPVARAYVEGMSPELRQSIHNFTNNVGEPVDSPTMSCKAMSDGPGIRRSASPSTPQSGSSVS